MRRLLLALLIFLSSVRAARARRACALRESPRVRAAPAAAGALRELQRVRAARATEGACAVTSLHFRNRKGALREPPDLRAVRTHESESRVGR